MTSVTEIARKTEHSFDQNEADAAWEKTQEHALKAFHAGQAEAAQAGWGRALQIAQNHFEWGDPRLATSYTNQAYALIRQKQPNLARPLFQTAIRCWEESWRWVPLMVPSAAGRQPDDARYSETAQKEFYDFIKRGQSITEALACNRKPPVGGLEDWHEHKPKTMCDVRKLIASVFLIVSYAA